MTALIVGGSAPIEGGSSSSADVPVDSSAAVSMSVEDMVQTNVLVPSDVRIQPSSSGTFGSLQIPRRREIDGSCVHVECISSKAQHGIGAVSWGPVWGCVQWI